LITDGAQNMGAVSDRLGKEFPNYFWLHCIAHCLNIILDKSCTPIDSYISFIKFVSNEFSFSSVNHASLHKIQNELEKPEKKIFRLIPTRWTSLSDCIGRIIEEWESLKKYFEKQKIKTIMEDSESLQALKIIHNIIQKLTKINIRFQNETQLTSYALYSDLRDFYEKIAKIILKPSKIKDGVDFIDLISIDFSSQEEKDKFFMTAKEANVKFKDERFKYIADWKLIKDGEKLSQMIINYVIEILRFSKQWLP
jgi:hypothetical protein